MAIHNDMDGNVTREEISLIAIIYCNSSITIHGKKNAKVNHGYSNMGVFGCNFSTLGNQIPPIDNQNNFFVQ